MADLKTDTEKAVFYNKKIEELRSKAEETKDLSKAAADLVIGDSRSNIFPPFGLINFIKTPDIDEGGLEKLADQTIKGTAPYIDRLEKSTPKALQGFGINEEKEFLDSKANAELNAITKTDFRTLNVGIVDKDEEGEAGFENEALEKLSVPDLQSILDTSVLKFLKEIGVKRENEKDDSLIISRGESVMKSIETPVTKKEEPKKEENPANPTSPISENDRKETTGTIENKPSASVEKSTEKIEDQKTPADKNTSVTNQNIVEKTQTNVTNNVSSPNTTNVSNNVISSATSLNNTAQSSTTENKTSVQKPRNFKLEVGSPEKITEEEFNSRSESREKDNKKQEKEPEDVIDFIAKELFGNDSKEQKLDNKTTPDAENKESKGSEDPISEIISGKNVTPKDDKNKDAKELESSTQTNEVTSLISKELGSADIDSMLDQILGITPENKKTTETPKNPTGNPVPTNETTGKESVPGKSQTPVTNTGTENSTEKPTESSAIITSQEKNISSRVDQSGNASDKTTAPDDSGIEKAQAPVGEAAPVQTPAPTAVSTTQETPIVEKAQAPISETGLNMINEEQRIKSRRNDDLLDQMLVSKSGSKIKKENSIDATNVKVEKGAKESITSNNTTGSTPILDKMNSSQINQSGVQSLSNQPKETQLVDKVQNPVSTQISPQTESPASSVVTSSQSVIEKSQSPVAQINPLQTPNSGASLSSTEGSPIVDKTQTPVTTSVSESENESTNSITEKQESSLIDAITMPIAESGLPSMTGISQYNKIEGISNNFSNPESLKSLVPGENIKEGINNIAQSINNTNPIQSKLSEIKNQTSLNPQGIAKTVSESPIEIKDKPIATQQPQEKNTDIVSDNTSNTEQESPLASSENSEKSQENPQNPEGGGNETKSQSGDKKDNSGGMNGEILQVMREILKTLQGPLITTESTPRFH